ncbi:uncharacterized protein LOC107035881 [Diachasma alloeum]|uniref:uncharacterized protein LOC107035881 n=1 Tax=Diachasma alloeum TaxID=454923 RepID=UPI00073828C2|nr:uncharacterized protein LOC107035881 [Diachasma alloeum]
MAFSLVQFIVLVNSLVFVAGIDVRVLSDADFRFGTDDTISAKDLAKRLDDDRAMRFIGDLTIGERQHSETVFSRTIQVSNPTPEVYRTAISVSVDNGIIHYLSVINDPGSYAVACDEPYSLGGSRSGFNLRVTPRSENTLTLIIAAH